MTFCNRSNHAALGPRRYLFFNSTAGANGYEAALAVSDDLLNWRFNLGGDHGIVLNRSAKPGAYDYGGVTLGGPPLQCACSTMTPGTAHMTILGALLNTIIRALLLSTDCPSSKATDAILALAGMHFASNALRRPRTLQKLNGAYHALYGCYPSRKRR